MRHNAPGARTTRYLTHTRAKRGPDRSNTEGLTMDTRPPARSGSVTTPSQGGPRVVTGDHHRSSLGCIGSLSQVEHQLDPDLALASDLWASGTPSNDAANSQRSSLFPLHLTGASWHHDPIEIQPRQSLRVNHEQSNLAAAPWQQTMQAAAVPGGITWGNVPPSSRGGYGMTLDPTYAALQQQLIWNHTPC